MSTEGVDYSKSRPDPRGLAAAGKRFVVRYGGPGSDAKHLHADERDALLAAGLSIVANAEGSEGGYRGAAAGRAWAAGADAAFRALGMPADRPIYFSVDFAAGPGDWADVDAALRGSADVIGVKRVGVYGGHDTIAHCFSAKTAAWFWQTYAWSGKPPVWHPAAHLQQYHNGVTVAGGDCDLNRAMTTDYGQWGQNMPLNQADIDAITEAVWGHKISSPWLDVTDRSAADWLKFADAARRDLKALTALIGGLEGVDQAAVVAGVLAGLTPAIVAALPVDEAQRVVDLLLAHIRA